MLNIKGKVSVIWMRDVIATRGTEMVLEIAEESDRHPRSEF